MATWYGLPGLATGNNDGTTAANAWKTWDDIAAHTGSTPAAGDTIKIYATNNSKTTVTNFASWAGTNIAKFTFQACDASWNALARGSYVILDGTGAGANVDGWTFNACTSCEFIGFEIKNFTRDGIRDVTAANTNLTFKKCSIHNNSAKGISLNNGIANTVYINIVDCLVYSNGTTGIDLRCGHGQLRRCAVYLNVTGFACITSTPITILDCTFYGNTTGITTSTSVPTICKNCVVDRNTTGIAVTAASGRTSRLIQCRITNNTTGITVPTAVTLETYMCGFYGNATRQTLTGTGVLEESDNVDMAADGYVNGAAGNYNLTNGATPAECRWTAAGVGDATNNIYWTAGLSPNPDFPTAANTFSADTVDGVTGTGTAPAAGKVMADAGNFGPGAATTPTLPVASVRDTATGGTLSSDKILKSNAVAGNWNDDNLSVGNVRPVAFGLAQTGDLSNLVATDAAYAALETTRNTDMAANKVENLYDYVTRGVSRQGTLSGGGALPAPGVPLAITPTPLSSTSIRIFFTWATYPQNLRLERSTDAVNYTEIAVISTISLYYYDDTGLTAGTAYYYRMRAYNTTGLSAYCAAVTATTRSTNEIEQTLWSAYKTLMQADVYLAAFVQKWKFAKDPQIYSEAKIPIFHSWFDSVNETWIGIPKRKIIKLNAFVHGIFKKSTTRTLEANKLYYDEIIKNAVEANNMDINAAAILTLVGNTTFNQLDEEKIELILPIEIQSKIFTAGAR